MKETQPKMSFEFLRNQLEVNPQQTAPKLENFIKEYMDKLEREGVILGLSGGLDSAVLASLCKRAVGPEKVLALIMPDKDSKKQHIKDAINLANQLKIKTKLIDITPFVKKFGTLRLFPLNKIFLPKKFKEVLVKKAYKFFEKKTGETPFSASLSGFKDKDYSFWLKNSNAYYRIKHRLRMVLLYLWAEKENRLVVGAANKTEAKIGFFVKHGCDDATDIMPLLGLYKTQVRQLATFLQIPPEIINKAPSPDIIPGNIDEEAIGMPYETLDLVLESLESNLKSNEIAQKLNIKRQEVEKIKQLTKRSEHMRQIYTPV